jgi:hypothetical protein
MIDLAVTRGKCMAWKKANPHDKRLIVGWDFAADEPLLLEQEVIGTYEYPIAYREEIIIGPFRLRRVGETKVEIMRDGEGGWFDADELGKTIERFVSERL